MANKSSEKKINESSSVTLMAFVEVFGALTSMTVQQRQKINYLCHFLKCVRRARQTEYHFLLGTLPDSYRSQRKGFNLLTLHECEGALECCRIDKILI